MRPTIDFINNGGIRSLMVLVLVIGSVILAISDEDYRDAFADLSFLGVGGYLGQLVPKGEHRGNSNPE